MGVGAADILYDAALALGQNDGLEALARDRPSFNASLLFSCRRNRLMKWMALVSMILPPPAR